jgi:hypothetical protein
MRTLLLRAGSLLLLWLCLGLLPAAATHLVGGELTYKFLDAGGGAANPYRYEITALVYFNKEQGSTAPDGNPTLPLVINSKGANATRLLTLNMPRRSFSEITPAGLPGCTQAVPRVTLAIYTAIVSLPAVPEGYKAVLTNRARNEGITNLSDALSESMTLSVDLTPGTLRNSSPAFSDRALVFVCLGDTSFVLNNAYDNDGDRLSYRLATPDGPGVNFPVSYETGYSAAQPFGRGLCRRGRPNRPGALPEPQPGHFSAGRRCAGVSLRRRARGAAGHAAARHSDSGARLPRRPQPRPGFCRRQLKPARRPSGRGQNPGLGHHGHRP